MPPDLLSTIFASATGAAAAGSDDRGLLSNTIVLFLITFLLLGLFFVVLVILFRIRHRRIQRERTQRGGESAEVDPWAEAGKRARP